MADFPSNNSQFTKDTNNSISSNLKSKNDSDVEAEASNSSPDLDLFAQKDIPVSTDSSSKKSKIQSAISGVGAVLPRLFGGAEKRIKSDVNRENIDIEGFSKVKSRNSKDKLFRRLFGVAKSEEEDLSASIVTNPEHKKPGVIQTVCRTVGGFLHNEQEVIDSDKKSATIKSVAKKIGFGSLGFLKIVSNIYSKLATIPFASGVEAIFSTVIGASVVTFFTVTLPLWASIAIPIAGLVVIIGLGLLIYKSPSLAKRIAIRSADKPMTFLQKRALNLLAIPLVLNGMFIKKVNLKQYYVVSDPNTRDIKVGKDNLVVFTSQEFLKRIGRIDTAKKVLRYVLNSYAVLGLAITILSIAVPGAIPSWLAFMVFKTILAKSLYIGTVFITGVIFLRQVVFPNKVVRAIKTMQKYSKSHFADMTKESREEVRKAANTCLALLYKHVTGNKIKEEEIPALRNSEDLLKFSRNYRSFADGVKSFFESNDVILRILRPKLLRLEKNMGNNFNAGDLALIEQAANQEQLDEEAVLDEIHKKLVRKELIILVDAFLDFCSMLNSQEYSNEQIEHEMLEDNLSERDNIIMSFISTQEAASG